jgi:hypothetical protein
MMCFELIIALFVKIITIMSKWLHDNLVANVMNLAKRFELVIVISVLISLLLFNLFLTIRYLRKLPKYYAIQVVDHNGNQP